MRYATTLLCLVALAGRSYGDDGGVGYFRDLRSIADAKLRELCAAVGRPTDQRCTDEPLGALMDGLVAEDHVTRSKAMDVCERLLPDVINPVDLRQALLRFDSLEDSAKGHAFLQRASFAALPRSARISAYRDAMVKGMVRYENTIWISRLSAMCDAAEEGMTELRPDIMQYYQQLDEADRNVASLDSLLTMIDLRRGATDRTDAYETAAARLSTMEPRDLLEHLKASRDWRHEVTSLTDRLFFWLGDRDSALAVRDAVRRAESLEVATLERERKAAPSEPEKDHLTALHAVDLQDVEMRQWFTRYLPSVPARDWADPLANR